jgi:hypothetical protein
LIFVIKIFHSHDLKKPSNYASGGSWTLVVSMMFPIGSLHLTVQPPLKSYQI